MMKPESPNKARQETQKPAAQNGAGAPPLDFNGVHPLMIASLPAAASGADVYARQFYRGSKVPFRRYLPVNSL